MAFENLQLSETQSLMGDASKENIIPSHELGRLIKRIFPFSKRQKKLFNDEALGKKRKLWAYSNLEK